MRPYVYLVLTYQVHARSILLGNSASAVDVQQVSKRTLFAVTKEDYSITADMLIGIRAS